MNKSPMYDWLIRFLIAPPLFLWLGLFASPVTAADIDLITNINSTSDVLQAEAANSYTVTVENRGPDTASNIEWLVGIQSAKSISNAVCVSAGGASCPTAFNIGSLAGTESITAVIPTMPVDSIVTLSFDTVAKDVAGSYRADSTVASTQTELNPETNEADINISILPLRLSWTVEKRISGYEDASGGAVTTPGSGDYVIYEVVVTNSGMDDFSNLVLTDNMGVDQGTGTAATLVAGSTASGYNKDFYAGGTSITEISCTAANGAVCPANQVYTSQTLKETIDIPFMPGRTRGALTDPVAYPASTLTFSVKALIGQVACTSIGGHRTILNRATLRSSSGSGREDATLDTPYGPGDSSDNTADTSFNVDATACPYYDVVTQVTESATQASGGIAENGPFEYTVTVTNNGPDTVINMPFFFGTHYIENSPPSWSSGTSVGLSYWNNYWSIDSSSCLASGGAVCPAGYTTTQQEDSSVYPSVHPAYWASGAHDLPHVEAVIPALPSGGTLTFTIGGTAGELDVCSRPLGINAHAHALPLDLLGETNIAIPADAFTRYYLRASSGWPGSNQTHGSYYGNNGFSLRSPWQTGKSSAECTPVTYDLSTTLTGPFPDTTSTTPIAGPLTPDSIVYYRVRVNNIDPGVDFLDPRSAATQGLEAALDLVIDPFDGVPWVDTDTETGIGTALPDHYHPLDQNPGLQADQPSSASTGISEYAGELALPYAAWTDVGVSCGNAIGGAECPDDADMTIHSAGFSGVNVLGEGGYRRAWSTNTDWFIDSSIPVDELNGDSLHLPTNSSMELLFPYHVPPLSQPCIPGGDSYVYGPGGDLEARIYAKVPGIFDYDERDSSNNRSRLTAEIAIPDCAAALEIDKRTVIPAANDVVPVDGIVRYEVDLTYPASATSALDVAQFIDLPSMDCGGSGAVTCANYEIVRFIGCSVTSGTAACPASIPIGQRLAQDGTLTMINAGTIDTRWGTPNATSVANGAAFEPGSSITITLEAQLSNITNDLSEVQNTAVFASDPDSSLYGAGMYVEDTELLSVEGSDSMVLQKSVSPADAELRQTVTYTLEAINNGPADGQGAYLEEALPAALLATNPGGYVNISCAPITTSPPLLPGPNIADCANVTITNNGTAGFRVDMTGSWVLNSGYRFTFEAIAPQEGTSVVNTATLTPPPPTSTQRFGTAQDSTANIRTPDAVDLELSKTVVPAVARRGTAVVYTLTVNNTSTVEATAIEITDVLPPGVTYVTHTPGETFIGNVWSISSLPGGGSKSLDITVTIN